MRPVLKFKIAVVLCGPLSFGMALAGSGISAPIAVGEDQMQAAGVRVGAAAPGSFGKLSGAFSAADSLQIAAWHGPAMSNAGPLSVVTDTPAWRSAEIEDDHRCTLRRDCEHGHVTPVPEPKGAGLVMSGIAVLVALRRSRSGSPRRQPDPA